MSRALIRQVATGTTALAVALTLAGCGGGSSGGGGSEGGGGASSSSDTRSASELAADRKLASQGLLKLSDFPEGWQATPSDAEDDDNDKFGEQLADCLDVPDSLLGSDTDDSVDSPDFESPDKQQISNSVTVGSSEDEAVRIFDVLKQPNATRCFQDALDGYLHDSMSNDPDAPDDVELGKLKLGELNLPQYADESVAFRSTVPFSSQGMNVDVNIDIIFMRHGRAASFLSFLDIFNAFPLDDEKKYAGIAGDRLTSLDV